MLYLLAQGFWFILPAMWGNMAPVWAKKIRLFDKLDIPVDANRKLAGKPILGRNKTYRGFLTGVIFALVVGMMQYVISENIPFFDRLEFFAMGFSECFYLSILIGFGALVGDAIESLLKRQAEINPGQAWFPMDQLDYVIGALLFSLPIGALSLGEYIATASVGFLMHPIATWVGWKIGLKDRPI